MRMRNGHVNGFIEENGIIIGYNLGYGFIGEHQFGYDPLAHKLHILPDTDIHHGINTRIASMKNVPYTYFAADENYKFIRLFNDKDEDFDYKYACFIIPEYQRFIDEIPNELKLINNHTQTAAWSDTEFGICVTRENKDKLDIIVNSLLNDNIAFMYDSTAIGAKIIKPHKNVGLCLIRSEILTEEQKDKLLQLDTDREDLFTTATSTGIHTILKNANKEYYALVPAFENNILKFWLNPHQQDKYNSGWFTVDELKLWAEDKGPVIK